MSEVDLGFLSSYSRIGYFFFLSNHWMYVVCKLSENFTLENKITPDHTLEELVHYLVPTTLSLLPWSADTPHFLFCTACTPHFLFCTDYSWIRNVLLFYLLCKKNTMKISKKITVYFLSSSLVDDIYSRKYDTSLNSLETSSEPSLLWTIFFRRKGWAST